MAATCAAVAALAASASIADDAAAHVNKCSESGAITSSSNAKECKDDRIINAPSRGRTNSLFDPHILATSSIARRDYPDQVDADDKFSTESLVTESTLNCDFLIVGHGHAGHCAAQTLRRLCPNASIVVVDPNHVAGRTSGQERIPERGNKEGSLRYIPRYAVKFDRTNQVVHLSDETRVRYSHSMLLATGSRGAPPPRSLFDDRALERVLELRSTEMPSAGATVRRPILPPVGVRHMALMAASQGANVCVLGSGLDAIELATAMAQASASSRGEELIDQTVNGKNGRQKQKGKKIHADLSFSSGIMTNDAKVALVFGSAGPFSNRIPRYLSTAVTKRLKQQGIDVHERALVRYVAMDAGVYKGGRCVSQPRLEVHTGKSYDSLDTTRTRADILVVAPLTDGQCGTAVLPAKNRTSGSASFAPYVSWSSLDSSPQPVITCYVDDGRIAVNSELLAASKIFAAGSVAKYPDHSTGHAEIAGEGQGGSKAGEIAAHNMAREYYERDASISSTAWSVKFGPKQKDTVKGGQCLASPRTYESETVKVWRTDRCSYLPSGTNVLASVGINALCIGNCDSETMATHGYWWTNQASDNRRNRKATNNHANNDEQPNRIMRRMSTKLSARAPRPIYGSGVVYYLDRSGKIRGIMTWGLPFNSASSGDEKKLNQNLVERMKKVIHTNGEITKEDYTESLVNEGLVHADLNHLSTHHLSEETKMLASIALAGDSTAEVPNRMRRLARPLHRYVPSKPSSITSIGVLRRGDETGHGGTNEDIFIRTISEDHSTTVKKPEVERPQSLIHVYPMYPGNFDGLSSVEGGGAAVHSPGSSEYSSDFGSSAGDERRGGDRSRPPKEEPLWLRRGDSNRLYSARDAMIDIFLQHVRKGQFSDGTDALQRFHRPEASAEGDES